MSPVEMQEDHRLNPPRHEAMTHGNVVEGEVVPERIVHSNGVFTTEIHQKDQSERFNWSFAIRISYTFPSPAA